MVDQETPPLSAQSRATPDSDPKLERLVEGVEPERDRQRLPESEEVMVEFQSSPAMKCSMPAAVVAVCTVEPMPQEVWEEVVVARDSPEDSMQSQEQMD